MEDYTQQSLDIIEHNQLLSSKELSSLEKIKGDLNHNFWVGQVFRSRVEMEVSVLSDLKYPTADSKYWQSIREQNVHFAELVSLSYEYRKNVQRIKILEAEVKGMQKKLRGDEILRKPGYELDKFEAEKEIKRIDIERMKWVLTGMIRVAKNRIREVLNWQDIMKKLKPIMKYSPDSYEEHQLKSYLRRFQNQTLLKQAKGDIKGAEMEALLGQHSTTQRVLDKRGIILSSTSSQTEPAIEPPIVIKEIKDGN